MNITQSQRDEIIASACLRDMVSRKTQTELAEDCNELEEKLATATKLLQKWKDTHHQEMQPVSDTILFLDSIGKLIPSFELP